MPAEEKVVTPTTNESAPAPAQDASQPASAPTADVPVETQEADTPPADDTPKVDKLIPSDPYYMDPLFYEVANYFGLQQEDYGAAKNKLAMIVDYVIREIESNDPAEVLNMIRSLEDKVQPPAWDEKRYNNLYKYIRLASKSQSIQQAMKAFEKGGFNG